MNFTVAYRGGMILGAVAQEDMYEGFGTHLVANVHSQDFGSMTDLPGCELPDTSGEAALSKWIVAMQEDNRPAPIYGTYPQMDYSLRRGGFDQASNVPITTVIYPTHPQNMEQRVVIPSGTMVKLYGTGNILIVPSGAYVYSSSLEVPGAQLSVTTTGGADNGKLYYSTSNVVAEVVRFESTDASLTFLVNKGENYE